MNINNLSEEIEKELKKYSNKIFETNGEALNEAEKVLINNLKNSSPIGETGQFAKSWKSTGKKYKNKRFIGNTKIVNGIPLINILEYSKKKGNPFVKKTFDNSISEMAKAYVDKIKGGI